MINDKITQVVDSIKNHLESSYGMENIEKSEKMVSVGAGAFIFLKGVTNIFSSPLLAVAELAIGGGLLYRGLTGYCPMKEMTERMEERVEEPVYVRETIVTALS